MGYDASCILATMQLMSTWIVLVLMLGAFIAGTGVGAFLLAPVLKKIPPYQPPAELRARTDR